MIVLASSIEGKAAVLIGLSDKVASDKNLDAVKLIREKVAPAIRGGGGGQKTLATAGGQDADSLSEIITELRRLILD